MKNEFEITVLVKSDYETLKKELEKYNFKIVEEFELNDIYMIDKNIEISQLSSLDILWKCILVRDVVNIEKALIYKEKKYAENMSSINYKTLFEIHDECKVFANGESELVVQLVNNEYIFIEMESECRHINRSYNSINELKNDINKYDLPIDTTSYFVKKAEILLENSLKNHK